MTRYSLLLASAFLLFLACKKSDKTNTSRTAASMSGTYMLTALTATEAGITFNAYDSLPPCEKDNLIQLNANGSAQFIDAGIACVPPEDSTGAWHLSTKADSIYLGNQSAFIQSYDGKTLVLSNQQNISGFNVSATETLVKQ
jgi:hypothetical protein